MPNSYCLYTLLGTFKIMSKTITFKNGKTILVTQEVANILYNRITDGCSTFQCFWDDEEGRCDRIINVSEIVCIE